MTSCTRIFRPRVGSESSYDQADASIKGFYGQSYEDADTMDSAVCEQGLGCAYPVIMPLVFFISAADPRSTSTLEHMLKT